jgi:hypothetical protein
MAKRGRPRNDSVQDFSVRETPVKGVYLVRFKVGREAFCATVRYGVPQPEDTVLTLSPYQTFKRIIERPYPDPDSNDLITNKKLPRLGASNDAVARRLTRTFLKFVRLLDLNRSGN